MGSQSVAVCRILPWHSAEIPHYVERSRLAKCGPAQIELIAPARAMPMSRMGSVTQATPASPHRSASNEKKIRSGSLVLVSGRERKGLAQVITMQQQKKFRTNRKDKGSSLGVGSGGGSGSAARSPGRTRAQRGVCVCVYRRKGQLMHAANSCVCVCVFWFWWVGLSAVM